MILSFTIDGCPQCGAPLDELARGQPGQRRTCSTLRCTACASEYLISAQLDHLRTPTRRPPRKPR